MITATRVQNMPNGPAIGIATNKPIKQNTIPTKNAAVD
jgi:hypothetical protein